MIVDNNDADLEVLDTCVSNSLLTIELSTVGKQTVGRFNFSGAVLF